MLQRGYQMDFTNQNFGVIIYGQPGIGKTTVALSDGNGGADTLLIDLERGVGRTKVVHRMNAMVLTADTYEEVLQNLDTPEAAKAKTIVIDTCGALVDYLKDWALRTKADAKTKTGAWNAMRGFGYVKAEIESFTNRIKNVMHKNVIYIFHCDEKVDKDGNPQQRLRCEGSFRNTVWTGIDFGGYMQMLGNQRVICFTPEQEFFAKGSHGIEGQIPLPTLTAGVPNNFMVSLFARARANMQAEQDEMIPQIKQYEETMEAVRATIAAITTPEGATMAAQTIPQMDHALTSKIEASAMLRDKAKAMGFKWQDGQYVQGAQAGDAQ